METRLNARVPVALKVVSRIEDSGVAQFALTSGNVFEANSLDISRTGISVASQFFLPKYLIIQLTFDVSSFGAAGMITVKGEVRHCENLKTSGYKIGINFIDIPDDFRELLSQFIASDVRRKG